MARSWQQLMGKSQEQLANGNLEDAQTFALQALATAELFPPDDRRQGISLELLCGILFRRKEFAFSEPFMCRLVEMYKRCLGPEHLDTGTVMHNVALMYHGWGKLEAADAYYQQAIQAKKKHLASEHPDMVMLITNYNSLRSALVPAEQAIKPSPTTSPANPAAPGAAGRPRKPDSLRMTGQFNVSTLPDSEFRLHE